jgi:hypothetical protein
LIRSDGQRSEHSTHFVDGRDEHPSRRCGEYPHVDCQFEQIPKLIRGPKRNIQVSTKLGVAVAAASFGDVRTDRYRRPADLIAKHELVGPWE